MAQTDEKIDLLEASMLETGNIEDCPLIHSFTPGLYCRQILMRKGQIIVSRIHLTTHQFFILQGMVSVFSENDGEQLLEAPFSGITTTNTRRVLYIHQDCIWCTTHPLSYITGEENGLSEEDKLKIVEGIENDILEPRINLITGQDTFKIYKNILNNIKPLESCLSQ